MRVSSLLVGFVGLLLVNAAASAQCYKPLPTAPDMCGPGFALHAGCGVILYPSYKVYPPFPPFQGMVSAPGKDGGPHPGQCIYQELVNQYTAVFPNHLFSRSPRDFYMIDVDPRTPTDYGLVRPYNSYWADRP
jgi:hypothetical protein